MTDIVNGLNITVRRRAILRFVDFGRGQIYGEAGVVFEKGSYRRITEEMRKLIAHGLVRALAPDEPRGRGETAAQGVTFYRLTSLGRTAMGDKR